MTNEQLTKLDENVSMLWGLMLLSEANAQCDDDCLRGWVEKKRAGSHDSKFGKDSKQSHFRGQLPIDTCQKALLDCCSNVRGADDKEKERNARAMCLAMGRRSERFG